MTSTKLRAVLSRLSIAAILWLAHEPLPAALEQSRGARSVRDAEQQLLRELPDAEGLRAHWVPLSSVPPLALRALIEAEDRHFALHPGVDPSGLVRAALLDLRHARVLAGGSTLAMQLARMSYGLPRTLGGKLLQMLRALQLTSRLGRAGVLEAYVNLAPFGRDVRGIAEASRVYLGKPLRDVTGAEAVLLAAMPRAPTAHDPHRSPERLLERRAQLLERLFARGHLSARVQRELRAEPLALAPFARSFRAPHAVQLAEAELARRGQQTATELVTTLDPALQRVAESACRRAVASLSSAGASGCAAVIMRSSSAELLALVGSPDYHDPEAGQVNAALSLRQPGSALKPFVYALAFEQGKRPSTRILDQPTRFPAAFGSWIPSNYDGRFHGEITLRRALACSYNVPAAKLTAELGPARVLERLRALGLTTLRRSPEHYGIGLALGVGEVTLLELVGAYATLARGGEYLAPTSIAHARVRGRELTLSVRARRRVFSPEVSYLVSHVLADDAARRPAFGAHSVLELPFATAVKTGTSSDYRDNWAIGYAGDVVVGVWVGRHDGAPMHGVSGVSGAGATFRQLLLAATGKLAPRFPPLPAGLRYDRVADGFDLTFVASAR